MFCRECGKPHSDDAMFCPSCGARISPSVFGSRAPPAAGKKSRGGKKTVALAGIVIVVLVVIAAGIYYVKFAREAPFGPDESTVVPFETATPAPAGGTAAATPARTSAPAVIVRTPTEVAAPVTGVWVRVSYLGGWTGSYGKGGALVKVENSGVRQYQVENPSGMIQATFRKDDGTNHELTVEIYKNGAVLRKGTTSAPHGSVDISATV